MWPIVGIAAKWIAREIVFSVAYHYGSKYVKKKMASREQKVKDVEADKEVVQEGAEPTKPGGTEVGINQGGDGEAKD